MSVQEANELLRMGVNGLEITKDFALSIYANPENWGKTYYEKGERGMHWFWKGPVICPFELADWAKK